MMSGTDRISVPSEGDRAFAAASWLVDDLVRSGLEHACLSPGSRSTPLALALGRHPGVRVHVHLDERASGFFALGIAKASGRPVAVATTSGTAAAELLPATVEAWMARVPLVLLTADRPPELRNVGANQTIDQPGLFGGYVRESVDAPVPGDAPDEDTWHRMASRVVRAAAGPPPGPVHVNLAFREPLVPSVRPALAGSAPAAEVTEETAAPAPAEVDRLVGELEARRGVVVAGSLRRTAPAVVELARLLRWPLLAEPTSGLRVPGALEAGQLLLATPSFVEAHRPELVLQVGAAPTSRAGLAYVALADRLVIVDPDDLVADPHRSAAWTARADPQALASAALVRIRDRDDEGWLASWARADERAREAVDRFLDALPEPSESRLARDLSAALPDGSTLVVGSSMPVRDLDAYMAPRRGLRILANRGASGIDGFVSTTLGVAATGAPTVAVCGDLTLLHDAGSLLWSSRRGRNAVFVVPNNDGGAIFSFLPQRELPEFEELFTTPHGLDLGSVCAAARAGHALVTRADDLVPAVDAARAAGGVHVVEVPIDRDRNVDVHARALAAVASALEAPTM